MIEHNPYNLKSSPSSYFVGRDREISIVNDILDQYQTDMVLNNIIVVGHKAIGKTALLSKYSSILEDRNFFVIQQNIISDGSEYDFFKNIFDSLFNSEIVIENNVFNNEQIMLWNIVTGSAVTDYNKLYSNSYYKFMVHYANYLNNRDLLLSENILISDFNKVISCITSPENNYDGICFIVDDVHKLNTDNYTIELLRILSSNVCGLMVIIAGHENIIDNVNIEHYARESEVISLKGLNNKESMELIFVPLQKTLNISRYHAEQLFDMSSVMKVISSSRGNPYDILVLCKYMCQQTIDDNANIIFMNTKVMDNVIDHYASYSKISKEIKDRFAIITREELNVFGKLYKYKGITLRRIIQLELAFNSISEQSKSIRRASLIEDIELIFNTGLFSLNDPSVLENKTTMDNDRVDSLIFNFKGNTIDMMYTEYVYNKITNDIIESYEDNEYNDILAKLLNREIVSSVDKNYIDESNIIIPFNYTGDKYTTEIIQSDYNELNSIKEENRDIVISKFNDKYDIQILAFVQHFLNLTCYIMIISDVLIKGDKKTLVSYISSHNLIDDIMSLENSIVNHISRIKDPLEEYNIKINKIKVDVLANEIFKRIYSNNISSMKSEILELFRNKDFDNVMKMALRLYTLGFHLNEENKLQAYVELSNDYAFCLMNIEDIDKAIEVFEEIKDKSSLSKANLAFAYACKENYKLSKNLYGDIVRKRLGIYNEVAFINLLIPDESKQIGYMILEKGTVFNVSVLNLALVNLRLDKSKATSFAALKKYQGSKDEIFERVKRYIKEYKS